MHCRSQSNGTRNPRSSWSNFICPPGVDSPVSAGYGQSRIKVLAFFLCSLLEGLDRQTPNPSSGWLVQGQRQTWHHILRRPSLLRSRPSRLQPSCRPFPPHPSARTRLMILGDVDRHRGLLAAQDWVAVSHGPAWCPTFPRRRTRLAGFG
ncbi:hypothetical protein LY76DRAFT_127344 [Colletotrichum caudatum]|nr:hypothetical protein LY76DRAFT_127344 [Colletotrichum caudatum]